MRTIKLSDKQFDGLERETRRVLMRQFMLLDTPRYKYSLGVIGNAWVIRRYDREEAIGKDKWDNDYVAEVVDSWL